MFLKTGKDIVYERSQLIKKILTDSVTSVDAEEDTDCEIPAGDVATTLPVTVVSSLSRCIPVLSCTTFSEFDRITFPFPS
mmetsp:Transcript_23044/g.22119  ORF Transcript_23044/g.22119 Transcript_23044/m.22119 type:complete len:80 (-) Transcript_23044:217-456(-)